MPPPAAAEVTFDQSVDEAAPLDDDEPLLPHPARTAMPITAATAAPVLFLSTVSPPTCMTAVGQDASIVAGERK